MINYNDELKHMEVWCDECNDRALISGDYEDCLTDIHVAGWKVKTAAWGQKHYCPKCGDNQKGVMP